MAPILVSPIYTAPVHLPDGYANRITDMLRDYGDIKQPGYYSGANGNAYVEYIDWNSDDSFNYRDVVYGSGGFDYISTGGGNDKIVLGSNLGTWHGSGNEFGNASIADGGSGNDDIYVRGREGSFYVDTGNGQDDVFVTGATKTDDFVRINAYDDDGLRDTFTFGASFNGDAEIWGVDAHDAVTLRGGDWHLASTAGGNVVYENATGASVTLTGVTHGYNDPDIMFS